MLIEQRYVNMFTDMMSEGLIVIDKKGTIQVYNNKAKEIFGILHNQQIRQEPGKIRNGDIVIIADNELGSDDGSLDSSSLSCIGIEDKNIELGDAIIAIGIFQGNDIKPVYVYEKLGEKSDNLELSSNFLGEKIDVEIDYFNKSISIQVNSEKYNMSYIKYIGHMVILDGHTRKMKFYQANGYTAKEESINDILKGKKYMAKGEDTEVFDVINKNIFEIHEESSTIDEFYKVAQGENISYIDEFKEINGFPTMCTLLPVDINGERIGAALKVEDVSEMRRVIRERDEALLNLEIVEKQLDEEKMLGSIFPNIISESSNMNYVKKLALKASKTNSTVLILGESGTGKTLLGKAIHKHSKNADKPFIHVNCGAIPETLLESELFGYEKGAFTGAKFQGKKGYFEMAEGGTIFLDEIGEMSSNLQVKLLQVLQDKCFYKVGGQEKVKVNVRIITATNKNLEEEMLKGRFREDLYYRINVFPIWIPPLRDRKQDLYPLVDIILPKICKEIGCEEKKLSGECYSLILKYNWPGNVRELENVLERAVNLCEGNTILSKHLSIRKNNSIADEAEDILTLKETLDSVEKDTIENVLRFYQGDKKKAMKALDISKSTFYEKLKKYNIGAGY